MRVFFPMVLVFYHIILRGQPTTDPLFFASSVFVKKPERVVALSFIMVLALLVYRLAEHLLRSRESVQSCPPQGMA